MNNDSFLVDRQTPLWLEGWKPGANAILLELVDPRGEPLNPPFNSVVTEVTLGSMPDQAPWQGNELPAETRAILLGEQPFEAGDLSADPTGGPQAPAREDLLKVPLPEAPLLEPPDLEGGVSQEIPAGQALENEQSPGLEDKPYAVTEPSDPMPIPTPEPGDSMDATDDEADSPAPEPLAALREGTGFEHRDRDTEEVEREQGNSKPGDPAFGDPEKSLGSEPGEIPADAIRATGSPAGPRQGWNS